MKPTTASSTSDASRSVPQYALDASRHQRTRSAYVLASGVFALAILVQVFLAGAAIFAEPGWWPLHRMVGMALALGPLVLLGLAFAARLPAPALWLNGLLLVLVAIQSALINVPEQMRLPVLEALHPVNAVLFFTLTVLLGHQVWKRIAQPGAHA